MAYRPTMAVQPTLSVIGLEWQWYWWSLW